VTPVLARVATQEWEWMRAWTLELVRFLCDDAQFGVENRDRIGAWVRAWLPQAVEAAIALAPLAAAVPHAVDAEQSLARVRAYAGEMLEAAGLPELCELVGHEPTGPIAAPEPVVRRVRKKPVRRSAAPARDATAPKQSSDGTYDFVGIVMAKSAEGDAVAAFLSERDDIEVIEQQSFWDIRASERLVIPYDEVSEQLGYEIDAYSIQHEMSTHYGRMVAADDALMLFSDPTEAMEYLMS
jgi:hypothetical protein